MQFCSVNQYCRDNPEWKPAELIAYINGMKTCCCRRVLGQVVIDVEELEKSIVGGMHLGSEMVLPPAVFSKWAHRMTPYQRRG